MRYIDITLPGEPHFSFDRSVPLSILYLLTKNKEILNVVQNLVKKNFVFVFTTAPSKTSPIVAIRCSPKNNFGRFLA